MTNSVLDSVFPSPTGARFVLEAPTRAGAAFVTLLVTVTSLRSQTNYSHKNISNVYST